MGCDKTLTANDKAKVKSYEGCFGSFYHLEAKGNDGLPSLRIHNGDDLDIDYKRNELHIYRPGRQPIGVVFSHSLATKKPRGIKLAQVQRAKAAILAGRMTEFHFLSRARPFPEDIRREIEKSNDELIEAGREGHLISYHSKNYLKHLPGAGTGRRGR